MPDNREWASLIWLGIAFIFFLFREDFRSDFKGILRLVLNSSILVPLGAMLAYVLLEVWVGSKLSLWRYDLTKPTIIWLVFSALVLFFKFKKASEEPQYFRRTIIEIFKITAFLEFYMNFSVLSLIGELILQLVLIFLVGISIVAEKDDQHIPVKKVADSLLLLIGISLLSFATWKLYSTWSEIHIYEQALQFALPIWLTIGLLPFIYLLGLYANYASAFRRINSVTNDWKARWRARLAVLGKLHFRIYDTHAFAGYWPNQVASASSFAAAWKEVARFQKVRWDARQAVIDEAERLRRYVGSNETDAEGRRLDRREFKETVSALRWLANCQMGWYPKQEGNRYWPDLLERLGDDLTMYDLPPDSGITMKVSEDGQAWCAWRRTITGWCFAIGAAGPPPDQWEYDGPEPPRGFPGRHRDWGERAFLDEVNKNWVF